MIKRGLLLLILSCALRVTGALATYPQNSGAPAASSSAEFDKLVDRYFDSYYQYHPTPATEAGFHQYDSKLEDYSRARINAEIDTLEKQQREFDQFPKSHLSEEEPGDFAVLDSHIKARLLELQRVQSWRKDPDFYTQTATYSIFLIMKRNFASQEDRLRFVIAREQQMPGFFQQARVNLRNPPHVYSEIALQQLPDTIGFFRNDVPAAFTEVKDQQLIGDFKSSNASAIKTLESYQTFLKTRLLAVSRGDFRIGAENYRQKLLFEEMVDIPLEQLLQIGYADLHRNQQRLKEVAAQIDAKQRPQEVLGALEKDHPASDQLLQTFRDKLEGLRQFIEQRRIITVPSQILPTVEETPPFERALTTASMDTPGAYETKATEAMFNVTLPEPNWKPERVEQWMEGFNRGTITSTAIHEVYPGHYVQFLWIKQAPSKTRKLLYAASNAEGWAHYCEQMMLDEGYGGGDAKLRIGQLQDALLRDARFIAGIEMHTGKKTLQQVKDFFVKEGYQVPAVADVEAKRGTSDPTYLVYTLGKLQIMKLREDCRKLQGDEFVLQKFHDRFMQQGSIPLKIIRRAMLGNDSPTL
jgi:uncharacterized protein (DUF885 family)